MSKDYDVDLSDPQDMLLRIENDPDSFTEGRRNNDMVNWFLAKVLDTPGRDWSFYAGQFNNLFEKFNEDQRWALRYWEIEPSTKVMQLHRYYGRMTEPKHARHYWIPVGYRPLDEKGE